MQIRVVAASAVEVSRPLVGRWLLQGLAENGHDVTIGITHGKTPRCSLSNQCPVCGQNAPRECAFSVAQASSHRAGWALPSADRRNLQKLVGCPPYAAVAAGLEACPTKFNPLGSRLRKARPWRSP